MTVTITDVDPLLRDFDFALGQLRHAYTHLFEERVKLQREFAVGLLSPEIRRLEHIRAKVAASADTHPKGGDAQQAPSPMGSAVGNAETPEQHRLSPSQPSKG